MTYTIRRCRAWFCRVGYQVDIYNADGTRHARTLRYAGTFINAIDRDPVRFWGNDGRTVRAEAEAYRGWLNL